MAEKVFRLRVGVSADGPGTVDFEPVGMFYELSVLDARGNTLDEIWGG
ncbi:hypothetical protein [Streptoalloteichus hindustanus]|uniref:Uncharacterized protein n=1 Tax=Streptoalloteichus hindustanus TaxID=2017 RepID=A0A1M5FC90_STRHI|nr:hypothetical protein [Streptoalloteichus hindustanus]SHF89154.1 hypothetical protein SAMN05444320_105371 [Streptoalloteichus hindustanus]